jgi:hypothetical protein
MQDAYDAMNLEVSFTKKTTYVHSPCMYTSVCVLNTREGQILLRVPTVSCVCFNSIQLYSGLTTTTTSKNQTSLYSPARPHDSLYLERHSENEQLWAWTWVRRAFSAYYRHFYWCVKVIKLAASVVVSWLPPPGVHFETDVQCRCGLEAGAVHVLLQMGNLELFPFWCATWKLQGSPSCVEASARVRRK